MEKASSISGGRAGGWTAETSSRPESGQGSLCSFVPVAIPRILHIREAPADATPGAITPITPGGLSGIFLLAAGLRTASETGSEGLSCFSDNSQRRDIYNSPWIAAVTLNRNKEGKSCLIRQYVRLIIYAAAISTAAVTAPYAMHLFYISISVDNRRKLT